MMVPRKSVLFCLVFGLVLYAGQVWAAKLASPHVKLEWNSTIGSCWFNAVLQCFLKTKELTEELYNIRPEDIKIIESTKKKVIQSSVSLEYWNVPDSRDMLIQYQKLLKMACDAKPGSELTYKGGWEDFYNACSKLYKFPTEFGSVALGFAMDFVKAINASSLSLIDPQRKELFRSIHASVWKDLEKFPKFLFVQGTTDRMDCVGESLKIPNGPCYVAYAMCAGAGNHFWAYGKDWGPNDKWYKYDDLKKIAEKVGTEEIKKIFEEKGGRTFWIHFILYRREDLSDNISKLTSALQVLKTKLIELGNQLVLVGKKFEEKKS